VRLAAPAGSTTASERCGKPHPTSQRTHGTGYPAGRRWRLFPGLVALAWLLQAPVSILGSAAEPPEPGFFQFQSLNRAYEMDDSKVAPVRQGPLTIHLKAPRNTLIIRSHSLTLRPMGDGTYRASVGVDLMGSGDLIADLVTDVGTSSRLEDLVVLPRQRMDLDARLRFERVSGGWDVTALALPARVELDIQSRLAGSLVSLCDQMAVFLGLDCGGIDRALSRVEVPLPEAGSVFYLPEAELTPAEAAAFDAYLGRR
jgi:hypothetical protein